MNDSPRSQVDRARSLAAALAPSELPPVNILIVDDEPRNLTVLETILNDPGYRLVRALSPDEALLALVNEEFALLILDIQMPGMNGFELAQTIKGRKKTSQIPIIFLTAHFNDDAHVLEGYGTGAVDYLQKPVNSAALRSKVAVFTELHRRGRDLALANVRLAEEVVERTRAEDELRRWNAQLDQRIAERTASLDASNARLRLATEAVNLGFWVWDVQTDDWSWENDWPTTALGIAPTDWPRTSQELLGRLEIQDAVRFAESLRAAAHQGGKLTFEGRVAGDRGIAIEIEGRKIDAVGVRPTILGTIRDITEARRSQEALLERERFLRTVTEAARVGIAVIDSEFRYRFVNDSFRRILNAPGAIDAGQRVGELNPQRWAKAKPAVERALDGESLSIEFSVTSAAPADGRRTTTHVCAFLEPHADIDRARTAAVVLIDITPMKQLEAELRRADRHKDEFLATLAHELRNPLAPIRNAVGILQHSKTPDVHAIRAGEMIERQVKAMARLIDDLMDVARINQGRLELRLAEVSLQDVISLAVEASRPQLDEMGHTLEIVAPQPTQHLLADQTRLAQVFTNILTNAAKYSERGGRIVLSALVDQDQVRITIQDSGIGIATENLERVFEMFSQVEVALARSRGGLGIGLSLAKRLVELHGGSITARSEGLGHGSVFEVLLPMSSKIVTEVEEHDLRAESRLKGLKVLVVDDNRDGAESLAALLEIHGLTVALAFDGQAAIDRAGEFMPDLALLDIGLPKVNGYEVCRTLKADPRTAAAKFVAITGWGDPKSRQAAFDAGFDHHFVKPVTERQLMETIQQLCEPPGPS